MGKYRHFSQNEYMVFFRLNFKLWTWKDKFCLINFKDKNDDLMEAVQ